MIRGKKSVRADKPLAVLIKVAFRSTAKTVTNNLPLLTVLACVVNVIMIAKDHIEKESYVS